MTYRVATKILHQTMDSWQSAARRYVSEATHPLRCIAKLLGKAYRSRVLRISNYVATSNDFASEEVQTSVGIVA